jgi:Fe-S oxidoreductase
VSFDASDQTQLLNCMHCGLCLPTCPTYQLTGRERSSPRGRIALMLAVQNGELDPQAKNYDYEMNFCLGCLACVSACPAGVQYGQLLESARDGLKKARPWWQRLVRFFGFGMFEHLSALRALTNLLRVYQFSGLQWVVRKTRLLPSKLRDLEAMLPPLPVRRSRVAAVELSRGVQRARVGMLLGCVMDEMFANENEATIAVLKRNGCTVCSPGAQGCCGALHAHAGQLETARKLARHNIAVFQNAGVEQVVVNSAGCSNAMKQYGHWLAEDPDWAERARRFSHGVIDVHQFLLALPLAPPKRRLPGSFTYHDACHLAHGQGIRSQPRDLMALLAEHCTELPRADRCCGSAGIYNLVHFETSMELLDDKVAAIAATGADRVGVANPGCLLQIRLGLRKAGLAARADHPIVLLAEAYALDDAET